MIEALITGVRVRTVLLMNFGTSVAGRIGLAYRHIIILGFCHITFYRTKQACPVFQNVE